MLSGHWATSTLKEGKLSLLYDKMRKTADKCYRHEPDLAKYNDFENARVYYLQERDILDQLDRKHPSFTIRKRSIV